MDIEKLENKIAFQIGFLIYSGKNPNDVIRDLKIIALEYAKQFQKEETQKCNVCGQQFDEDEECPTGHRQS